MALPNSLNQRDYESFVDTPDGPARRVVVANVVQNAPDDILLTNNKVADGSIAGTFIGQLLGSGGTPPYTFAIISDPDSKFQILNDNQLFLAAGVDIDVSAAHNVTIQITDDNAATFQKQLLVEVVPQDQAFVDEFSLFFNGVDEICQTDTDTGIDGNVSNFTFSCWIKTNNGSPDQVIWSRGNLDSTVDRGIRVYFASGGRWAVEVHRRSGSQTKVYEAQTVVNDNSWHHLMVTFAPNDLKLFTNSIQETPVIVSNGNVNEVNLEDSVEMLFGAVFDGSAPTNYYEGQINEPAIWVGNTLTPLGIAEVYNGGQPNNLNGNSTAGQPTSWWRVDASTGGILQDVNQPLNNMAMLGMTVADNRRADTPSNPAFVINRSISFDGVSEYINFGPTPPSVDFAAQDTWSASFWVKTTGAGFESYLSTFSGPQGPGWRIGKLNSANGNVLTFEVRQNPSRFYQVTFPSFGSISTGNWIHVLVAVARVQSTAITQVFINGSLQTATLIQDSINNNLGIQSTGPFTIGRNGVNNTEYVFGNIDQVAIYDDTLNLIDAVEIYNNGEPPDLTLLSSNTNLIHWWQMGEGDAFPLVIDGVGSVNGVMTNMTVANFDSDVPS